VGADRIVYNDDVDDELWKGSSSAERKALM
jgi:hypothetical protein